ncbi:MAG: hypothetical protein IJB91_03965, partial [Oscillospiraceae bacterium]|nr:hypothetical protein [Oscillospiraceae bacterium]
MRKEQFKWAADAPVVHIFGEDVPREAEPGKKTAAPKPLTKTAARPRTPVLPELPKAVQAPGSATTTAATPKRLPETVTHEEKPALKTPRVIQKSEPVWEKPVLKHDGKTAIAPTPLPLFTVPGEVKPAVKITPLKAQPQRSAGLTKAVQAPGSAATAAATPKPVQQTTTTKPLQRGIVKPTLAPELGGEQPVRTGTKPVTQPKLTLKDQPKAILAPELGAQKEVGRTKAPSDEGAVKLPKLGNLTEGEKGRSFREPRVPILAPELKRENPAVSTPKRTMTPNTPAEAILAPEQEEKTPEQKVMNWIIDWAGRNGIFTDNFKNRYANRTWDYTDAYVGDAQDYLDMVKRETQNFEAELNGIRELMAQCNFSPEQMEHIDRLLNLSAEHYKLIRQTAEEDAAHWSQFGSGEEYQKVLEAAKIKVELDEMAGVKDEVDKLLSQISTFNPYAYADAAQAAEAEQALKAQLAELTKPWGGWNSFENAYAEKQEQYNSLLGIETGSWFQKGAFADGYQFGDITKTLVGTVNDINENITHAVLDATENLIDTGAFVVGQVARRNGATDIQDKVGDFIAKEPLTKDGMGAKLNSILNWTTPHGQATKLLIGDNTEENSVLGDKADGLTQSAAHLAGSKALSMVGIPAELTMGVNAFGSEIENAYKNGASHAEALISGAVAVGAEILFEKLSGGIKFGGKTLDEGATKALSRNLSNRII